MPSILLLPLPEFQTFLRPCISLAFQFVPNETHKKTEVKRLATTATGFVKALLMMAFVCKNLTTTTKLLQLYLHILWPIY